MYLSGIYKCKYKCYDILVQLSFSHICIVSLTREVRLIILKEYIVTVFKMNK